MLKADFHKPSRSDSERTKTRSGVVATRILNVPVSTINMEIAVKIIMQWVSERESNYICVRDVHGIMRAQEDPNLMNIHDQAGLVTPDGMPLVWIMRARGYKNCNRVCGADLVDSLCRASQHTGIRHYFYGGKAGVADRMAAELSRRFPGLQIAGTGMPPFRPMTKEEDRTTTENIASTGPDIIWIGLSTPKQEYWMRDHVGRIPGATLIGIGAAFDFYAGDVKRAPKWMHYSGLEWLHRLGSEPRRLWRRYLVLAPKFVALVVQNGLRNQKKL